MKQGGLGQLGLGVLALVLGACSDDAGAGGAGGAGAGGSAGSGAAAGAGAAAGSGGGGGVAGVGASAGSGGGQGAAAGAGGGGALPSVGGCSVFTATSPWNEDIGSRPVHRRSADYLASFSSRGATAIHLDLGSEEVEYGIPYSVVPEGQPLVPISYGVDGEDYSDESDPGPFPIPLDAPIEGGRPGADPADGDRHVLVIQQGSCILYELYLAVRTTSPAGYRCAASARWDLKTNSTRPAGWTSADAAGLPIFPGLLRYDEVAAGEIRHAIRVTAPRAQRAYIAPASHFGPNADPTTPPYGLRLRLRASFDESAYSAEARVLLRAFKRYGLIFADQGTGWYVSGTSDPRWAPLIEELHQRRPLRDTDFEAVDTGPITCGAGAGRCD